jgi:hypothetical protein
VLFQFLAQAGEFFLHNIQTSPKAYPISCSVDSRCPFPGCEVGCDHFPSSSVSVKNAWCYTSSSPCLHVVHWDKFVFVYWSLLLKWEFVEAPCIMNKQMHTWLTVYYTVLSLSLLHVSTPTHHPQGALTWCLLSYINMFIQCWWYFLKKLSHPFFRIVKTLKLS